MTSKQKNEFQFSRSQYLDQVTVLQAEMSDFSYNRHAHEEYSFGVTLTGRQDFFASGEFHHSHPGNIMVFNPDEVHDGHSGGDVSLQYRMLYIHPDQLNPLFSRAGIKPKPVFSGKRYYSKRSLFTPLYSEYGLND